MSLHEQNQLLHLSLHHMDSDLSICPDLVRENYTTFIIVIAFDALLLVIVKVSWFMFFFPSLIHYIFSKSCIPISLREVQIPNVKMIVFALLYSFPISLFSKKMLLINITVCIGFTLITKYVMLCFDFNVMWSGLSSIHKFGEFRIFQNFSLLSLRAVSNFPFIL